MISFIKSWCEGIIVAVVISIIIEMIVPEGNNKKYIKVVIGIFIIFVTLNPILQKIDNKFSFSEIFENQIEIQTYSTNLNNNIKNVYIDGISNSIKKYLEEKGYIVKKVIVSVDNNYENLEEVEIYLSNVNENKNIIVKPIIIGENLIEEKENIEIKKMISENYQIDKEKIYIFEN